MTSTVSATPPHGELMLTKLFRPELTPGLVERLGPQLALSAMGTARLTVIEAPAGWGKTSEVVAALNAVADSSVAWLSLDLDDNDVTRFWSYLMAALQRIVPAVARLSPQRAIPASNMVRDLLPRVVNELTSVTSPLFVVLDDYHVVTAPEIHRLITEFVQRIPPQVHLVLATRTRPALPLPSLRARRQVIEIGVDDLRFTAADADRLLNQTLRIRLTPDQVARLHARTEGWVAGLLLAALSLRGRTDAQEFIDQFAGDDRHVVDYLAAEVLDTLPSVMRTFLIRTSILERLSGPLCDEVTGGAGSTDLLRECERTNRFLIALDHKRQWYRYHQLFGELLQHELCSRHPDDVGELHRRAARWFDAHGYGDEAVAHAAAVGDPHLILALVSRHWLHAFNNGHLAIVDRWLRLLPADVIARDPALASAGAWLAMDRGDLLLVDRRLTMAEQAGTRDPRLQLLRALHTFKSGDLRRAVRLAEATPVTVDDFDSVVRGCLRGVCRFWSGDFPASIAILDGVAEQAQHAGNPLAAIYSLGYEALAQLRLGNSDLAESALRTASGLIENGGPGEHFVAMMPALANAELASERGCPGDADTYANQALALARRGAGKIEQAMALLSAGRATDARVVAAQCVDPGPTLQRALARAHATTVPSVKREGRAGEPLTTREAVILQMLPGWATQREIAGALYISPNTLKTHLKAVYRKLGVVDRPSAVERARELGLLAPPSSAPG